MELSKPCAAIKFWQRVYHCAKLCTLRYVHMIICVILYALYSYVAFTGGGLLSCVTAVNVDFCARRQTHCSEIPGNSPLLKCWPTLYNVLHYETSVRGDLCKKRYHLLRIYVCESS